MHLTNTTTPLLTKEIGGRAAIFRGDDTITAGNSDVTISGGVGALTFVGGSGSAFVALGSGCTTLFGGSWPRTEELSGGGGNSTLLGGGGSIPFVNGSVHMGAAARASATTIGDNGTLTFEDTANSDSKYAPRPA